MTAKDERYVGIALVGLAALALAARIVWVSAGTRTIAGDGRAGEVKLQKHRVSVHLRPGVQLAEAVDLAMFGEFKPGVTFDSAVAIAGPPNNIRHDRHNVYYEFWRPESRVEVGREEFSSGDDQIEVSWALYAYPTNMEYSKAVVPEVARHVDPAQDETGLTITTADGKGIAFLYIRGTRVVHVIWAR